MKQHQFFNVFEICANFIKAFKADRVQNNHLLACKMYPPLVIREILCFFFGRKKPLTLKQKQTVKRLVQNLPVLKLTIVQSVAKALHHHRYELIFVKHSPIFVPKTKIESTIMYAM